MSTARRPRGLVTAVAMALAVVAGAAGVTGATSAGAAAASDPPPPKLTQNFHATGRYLVPDLGIDVPFTWDANGGDTQMTAGSEDDPIYFTNIISDGYLYTLTYKWPGLARRPCSPVGPFTLDEFNAFLANARYAGEEILLGSPKRRVHHWRAGVVWEPPSSVVPPDVLTPVGGTPDVATDGGDPVLRIPLMLGDFYVDAKNPSVFRQVLHFGVQNLYDAELDEWMVMDRWQRRAGTVDLPQECATAPKPATP